MNKLLLCLFIGSVPGTGIFGQYCLNAGPSSTIDSNLEWLTLVGESGSLNYTGCPGVTGVEYHSSETVFLNAGGTYVTNLQFGTCGGNYSGAGEAWIDFNSNQLFEASESIGTWQGTPPTSASAFTINVPVSSLTGLTRMRVMQHEAGSLPLDPCGTYSWGSVTDFNVYIQNGVDCSAYLGDNTSSPREVQTLPFTENYSTSYCYTSQNPVYPSPDIYYKVKVPGGVTSLHASLCGSSFDTFLTATDKDGTVININDDAPNCGTQSELEISVAGLDSVYFIVEGWGSEAGDYTISIAEGTLNTAELSDLNSIKIYPNPTSGNLVIETLAFDSFELQDLQGRLLQENAIHNGSETLNLSDLSPGTYTLILSNPVASVTKKIIKL